MVDFNLPHLRLATSWGLIPFEFRRALWHQKARVPGLSCGIICVILCLAVLIQYQSVANKQIVRHTHRQTHDDSIYRASIASRGKNVQDSHILSIEDEQDIVSALLNGNIADDLG